MRGVCGFRNPRYGRLGSLRYGFAYEISGQGRAFKLRSERARPGHSIPKSTKPLIIAGSGGLYGHCCGRGRPCSDSGEMVGSIVKLMETGRTTKRKIEPKPKVLAT